MSSRGTGDISSLATVPESTSATAEFLAKQDGVLAGVAVATLVFHMVDPNLKVRAGRPTGQSEAGQGSAVEDTASARHTEIRSLKAAPIHEMFYLPIK